MSIIIYTPYPLPKNKSYQWHHKNHRYAGGTDDWWNLCYIPRHIHVAAHKWLFMITGDRSAEMAYIWMSTGKACLSGKDHPNYELGKDHPNYGKRGPGTPNYGNKHTNKTKKKISESLKGDKCFWYGKKDQKKQNVKFQKPEIKIR